MLRPTPSCLMVLIPAVTGHSLCLKHVLPITPTPNSSKILYFLFRPQVKHHINELFLDFSSSASTTCRSLMYDVSLFDSMCFDSNLLTKLLLDCKMIESRLCLVHHQVPRAWHTIDALGIFVEWMNEQMTAWITTRWLLLEKERACYHLLETSKLFHPHT